MGSYTSIETKTCSKCGELKTIYEFYFRKDRGKYMNPCKDCKNKAKRERYKKNLEKYRAMHRGYQQKRRREDPEIGEKDRLYQQSLRIAILTKLGGKCVRCGYNDFRALEVDHINNDGAKERNITNKSLYLLNLPDRELYARYQCLCANCNSIKRLEYYEELRVIKYG